MVLSGHDAGLAVAGDGGKRDPGDGADDLHGCACFGHPGSDVGILRPFRELHRLCRVRPSIAAQTKVDVACRARAWSSESEIL